MLLTRSARLLPALSTDHGGDWRKGDLADLNLNANVHRNRDGYAVVKAGSGLSSASGSLSSRLHRGSAVKRGRSAISQSKGNSSGHHPVRELACCPLADIYPGVAVDDAVVVGSGCGCCTCCCRRVVILMSSLVVALMV